MAATASDDKTIRLWELPNGRELQRMTFQDKASAISFSPNGQWLVGSSEDGSVVVMSVDSGTTKPIMKVDDKLSSLEFNGDGTLLVVEGYKAIYLIDVESGQERYRIEPVSKVEGMAFSRDGKYILSLQNDGTARLWDSLQHRQLSTMEHDDAIVSAACPDGRYVATASWDKTVKLWLLSGDELIHEACARVGKNLAEDEWRNYLESEPYRKTCPNLP
jgi:WD40 repeat protein